MKIFTTKGVIDTDLVAVQDVISYTETTREIGSEYRLREDYSSPDGAVTGKKDELVRRDVWVVMMATPEQIAAALGKFG